MLWSLAPPHGGDEGVAEPFPLRSPVDGGTHLGEGSRVRVGRALTV